jgi:hypothetical protein
MTAPKTIPTETRLVVPSVRPPEAMLTELREAAKVEATTTGAVIRAPIEEKLRRRGGTR